EESLCVLIPSADMLSISNPPLLACPPTNDGCRLADVPRAGRRGGKTARFELKIQTAVRQIRFPCFHRNQEIELPSATLGKIYAGGRSRHSNNLVPKSG